MELIGNFDHVIDDIVNGPSAMETRRVLGRMWICRYIHSIVLIFLWRNRFVLANYLLLEQKNDGAPCLLFVAI